MASHAAAANAAPPLKMVTINLAGAGFDAGDDIPPRNAAAAAAATDGDDDGKAQCLVATSDRGDLPWGTNGCSNNGAFGGK